MSFKAWSPGKKAHKGLAAEPAPAACLLLPTFPKNLEKVALSEAFFMEAA